MRMEDTEVSRRRVSMIAAHFAANDDVSAMATHVLPVNCSGSLTSFTQRRDNKVSFARQGSSSQACFMRQVSAEPQEQQQLNTGKSENQGIPYTSTTCSIERYRKSKEGPLFSRPIVQDYTFSASEPPRFARPYSGDANMFCEDIKNAPKSNDSTEWSPRMDIGEQGYNYLLLVELPGVCTKDIRVEVNNESLVVKGKRSVDLEKVAKSSDSSISGYHKMGIFQGPYHVSWPLPSNVDKDNVSAEFVNGLLRISIPKL
ncbi:uncharacterized protein LOC108217669 isoform X1 [Daucus carota subsp. sativus]|uniref:uncharacterized protein LOC108217669 isoform X1 n=1 Tax=Daucus carota subsp. sativus TaxID=79200 RepID=UPI0007EEFE3D|nr:PREDICTED: uncharacterized protein LOC108217669 isoform X1 [Daucus carota subsp. sativus]